MLKPLKGKIYHRLHIDENVESIKFCKHIIVFCFITITWVFFKNGTRKSLHIIRGIIFLNPLNFFDSGLLSVSGTVASTYMMIIAVMIFCIIQSKRQNEEKMFETYNRQPLLMQCIPAALVICICIFGACTTDANVDTQFLYFQF